MLSERNSRFDATGRPTSIRSFFLVAFIYLLALADTAKAFTVAISDKDQLRQTCSGMVAGGDSRIEAFFHKGSTGTVATMFYEFEDFSRLGKLSSKTDAFGYRLKSFVCTPSAVTEKLCTQEQLGNFIVDDSNGPASTVQLQRMDFGPSGTEEEKTLRYNVTKTGYYCFGATEVPLASLENAPSGTGDVSVNAAFAGRVEFFNKFHGNLPAAEYPKLNFYFSMTLAYIVLGAYWLSLCIKHRDEMLTVQYFISGTIGFLVLEMAAQWVYYYYLNNHLIDFFRISEVNGRTSVTAVARFLLVLTSVLDAGRNSLSFFLLLIVSMGYGVIRPSIGPVMTRVRLLTAVHFVFGVLYSVGIVLIQLDQGGAWTLAFIFPLSMTLTAFLTWTMNSLKASIEHLTQRKQTFKREMFVKLRRILLGAVVVIFFFFIASSVAFSQSGGEGFAPNTWQYRWFLLDGWLALLYFAVFCAIAWLWRPTGHNMRLAMSDELATDDDPTAEGYEVDTFAARGPDGPDSEDEDDVEAKKTSQGNGRGVRDDAVVFEIGDEEDDGDVSKDVGAAGRKVGSAGERQGLMAGSANNSEETLVPGKRRADKND
ncbi:Transmembrane receptor, eukaryota [Kalmanozyma brasiliensis GHG001]|uniref:Transmembrane receptor, eukaryota n=1 Tax=Kalmanozyma brasiliensis (strain GHG001) TaxID=1365824 RepID=UPI0028680591|nr:Transmembrane receptor, eukaryota [Kalmanozyma brasiliensis GHG001]EST08958.2 Transmembrane receptor, eukaryota [Kalmanozyma brasiliensis GHG001]